MAATGDLLNGRYELEAELGRGQFGAVFRARDRVADERVAIKLILRTQADAVARVRRELKAARKVSHPGVVRIHDVFEVEGTLALSMELVEGETLELRLRREPKLPAAALSSLAADLARALAAAHTAGVTHRDLKPANIILRATNGRAVLTDFGISRVLQLAELPPGGETPPELQLTVEGALVGTPLYMAPEQLSGGEIGPAADIYAAGVVLYQAATGELPHQAGSLEELQRARLADVRPSLRESRRDLPDGLRQTIERCLAPDPRDRPADGTALKNELMGFLASSEFTGRIPISKRKRVWAAAAVLLGVAATAGWGIARLRGGLPEHDRRVAILAHANEPWLQKPIERLAARALAHGSSRVSVVDDPALANVRLAIEAQSGATITLDATLGRRRLAPVQAVAVADAVDRLIAAIQPILDENQPERLDLPGEARSRRIGARTPEVFRRYNALVDLAFGAVWFDKTLFDRNLDALLRLDPVWAHPYALLLQAQGAGSAAFGETLARARKTAAPGLDRTGGALLDAFEANAAGDTARATTLLEGVVRADGDDLVAGWSLARLYERSGRRDEAIALFRDLTEKRPELQFGADLEAALRAAGRGREVPAVQERWIARAPEGEQALASQVAVDIEQGRLDDALLHARRTVALYGAPHRLGTLADTLLLAGDLPEAARVIDQMLRGSEQERMAGWYRKGQLAVIEGRFANAEEAFGAAVAAARSFGVQLHLVAALRELRTLATIESRTAERIKWDDALVEALKAEPAEAAVARFDARLAGGECPTAEAALTGVPDGAPRRRALRALNRAAAAAGCASCAGPVREGLSTDEPRVESLFDFARCAAKEGQLELASDVLDGLRHPRTGSNDTFGAGATALSVLSELERARVRARLGDAPGARSAYDAFLGHWGHADRPLDTVAAARKERDALAR
jgi:tetratricopeptide (TPR) repeat protein